MVTDLNQILYIEGRGQKKGGGLPPLLQPLACHLKRCLYACLDAAGVLYLLFILPFIVVFEPENSPGGLATLQEALLH